MRITERDEYHAPFKGVLVAIGRGRDDIQPAALERVEESKRLGTQYAIFKAFKECPRLRTEAEWIGALSRVAQRKVRSAG